MAIPAHYKGREQAYIKHELLKNYLERFFMIIGQHAKSICYVDCFAGPWQEGSKDNLEGTSIAISLKIIKKCIEALQESGKDVHFKALYLEKDKEAYYTLSRFLKKEEWSAIETHCYHGEFFDLRDKVLEGCGKKDFTFFFIDPKGWTDVVIPTLSPLLKRPNSEFLINFMYDFVLRAHSQTAFEKRMIEMFGEVPNTSNMTPKEKESYIIKKYRSCLKNALSRDKSVPRSACVKVLNPIKNRTKYDLVYLTRHEKGIIVFMEASEKLDLIQKEVRAKTKQDKQIEKSGQFEMFGPSAASTKHDEKLDLCSVKEYWLEKLSTAPKKYGNIELADMLEDTDWFISDFQNAFRELEQEGKVKNLDAKRIRPKNAVNFEKGECLMKIIL